MKNKIFQYQKWSLVILLGLLLYATGNETLHFFNHFFPGVSTGVVILLVLLLIGKPTKRYEFSIPFFTYVFAIIPEFIAVGRTLFLDAKLEHAQWENIFLFHNTLDHWLEQTELIIPVTGLFLAGVLYVYIIIKNKKNHENI